MENKQTAVQMLFIELEQKHPYLFNIYTSEGRTFINNFHKYIEIEKQQIIEAYQTSHISMMDSEQYYNDTYGTKG